MDDWEELRTRAAAIKDATLAGLDEHLLGLEEALTANGAVVHWANDAAEACAVVAEVARAHGADEVLKVKSMATQEIGLNEALAEAGIQAWETDLAELIVQLGDDLPSHILVPAIHRNRAEIRAIFEEHMAAAGRPAPDGPDRRPGRAGLGGAAAPAREVPAREGGGLGRELRGRGDRDPRGRRVRGERPDVPDPAGGAGLGGRHREGGAELRRPRRVPAAAAALLDGGADEPVHLDVVRRHSRRRAAGGARRPGRPRPDPRTRRRGGPPGAALHPLLGMPERLPGLRAGRRTRLRLGVPRTRSARSSTRCCAAWAPTRRSTRCPTPPRSAAPATRSAR